MAVRALFVAIAVALVAVACADTQVSESKRKVDFVLRTKRFSGFRKLLKVATKNQPNFSKDFFQDVGKYYIAVVPTNKAINANKRLNKQTPIQDGYVVMQHLTYTEAPIASEALFGGQGTQLSSLLATEIGDSELDLSFRDNRFNAFVNDAVVAEIIVCQNGLVVVVDAVLELPEIDVQGKTGYYVDAPLFLAAEGLLDMYQAPVRKYFSAFVQLAFDEFNDYYDFLAANAGIEGLKEARDQLEEMYAFAFNTGKVGPLRTKYIAFAPLNKPMARGAMRAVKKQTNQFKYIKFVMENTCKVSEAMTYSMLLAEVQANGKFECTNFNQRTLTVTINPDGPFDGLEVNGVSIPKVLGDLSIRNGAIIAIDGYMFPDYRDLTLDEYLDLLP
eukprot:m.253646 g.253646  ORF g.253646 m.253646 type:complete len:388 (-) comp15484_c0_seq2:127-1290(-)